jgi:hemolysin III
MAAKLFLPTGVEKRLSVALYLGLGWGVFLFIGPVSAILPLQVLWLIALGGALYSVGVIFHLCEQLPYQNAVWHGFVVAGAATHFLALSAFVTR